MARIAGINIPQNKVVSIALTYIHGIGLHSSKKICKELEIPASKRVNDLGYKSVFLAESSAYHLGGGVSQQVKAKRLFYSLRSKSLYAKKHFSYLNYLFICLLIYSIELISRIVFSLLRLDFRAVFETLSAYKMLLMWSLKR